MSRHQQAAVRGSRRQWIAAAVALAKSGTLTPPGPRAARDIVRARKVFGASPATLFAISAARYPDRVALIDEAGSITYRDLLAASMAMAADLRRDALGDNGGSVGILCRNHRGFVIGLAAAAQTNSNMVPINTELPSHQLAALLQRHRFDALVHDTEFAAPLTAAGWAGHSIIVDAPGHEQSSQRTRFHDRGPATAPAGGGPHLTLLTSGTTGLAKGVPRQVSPAAIAKLAATGLAHAGLGNGEVVYVAPPFFHGFGLLSVLGTVTVGGTIVCRRRFDAEAALDDMARHRTTMLHAVPAMLQRIVNVPDVRSRAQSIPLRTTLTGAAPITTATVVAFQQAFGNILVNGYGSTEAGVVSIASANDLAHAPGTAGRPALGVSIRILDDAGTIVDTGVIGRIMVRGPLDYEGYTPDSANPTQSKTVLDGHVDTGDRGHIDADGLLFIDGRSDDMIVSGGENVFPGEIEDALASHPAVADAVVIGVPDTEFGQVLNAFIVVRDGQDVPADELKSYLRERVERYKIPKRFITLDEIPRNASGKVLRSQLSDATNGPRR
ncbi:AMP-binding protein [Jongsikchunia kroppenstedtii]|uniref:AMP-binding protein n=1 Tax=Jongsikchunia kroppenstedtii TaxID=1121721 RepID=UPI000378A07F|nr:AMP-binding protein [Jongsikchunia kroppenstedtii]